MPSFDIVRVPLPPSSPRHTRHGEFLKVQKTLGLRRHLRRIRYGSLFTVLGVLVLGVSLVSGDSQYYRWTYEQQAAIEGIVARAIARSAALPVIKDDPKQEILAEYLSEKKSPLAGYAGLLSRMPNWKLLVGIAHAESNMCKKTNRNNCWGIGPGSPWSYEDIAQSLYHADYLLSKFNKLGMKSPESLVRTYVGYQNPNWVRAVNNVFDELEQRGLQ